jgi:hypothetical protein
LEEGADLVVLLVVVEADGEVNEGLKEKAAGVDFRGPGGFEDFVAFEEFGVVEEVDALLEEWVQVSGMPA